MLYIKKCFFNNGHIDLGVMFIQKLYFQNGLWRFFSISGFVIICLIQWDDIYDSCLCVFTIIGNKKMFKYHLYIFINIHINFVQKGDSNMRVGNSK